MKYRLSYDLELNSTFQRFASSLKFHYGLVSFLEFTQRLHVAVHRGNGVFAQLNNDITCLHSGFLCRFALGNTICSHS